MGEYRLQFDYKNYVRDVVVLVFSSIEFLLCFLPIFILVYMIVPPKLKNAVLVLGSMVFYAYGNPLRLGLLVVLTVVNYMMARRMNRRRTTLAAALAVNFGVLIFFKFYQGGEALPMGISFYTFQAASYLIDVYRRDAPAERNFIDFAAYIMMFPKLVMGPITSYMDMRRQLHRRRCDAEGLQEGLKLFILGLGGKVLLADRLALLWHEVQVTGFESISTPLAWLAALAYSLELYFDFAGYSLMAAGLGRMLGFRLPENFRQPYMAGTVREFYRRWHMTLGEWFCKYVYIPLGGSRCGEGRTICNLLAVWMLTSLWHGVTGNFLVWGMGLCLLVILERQAGRLWKGRAPRPVLAVSHLYLCAVIPVTWMCFAITDLEQLGIYLGRMFGLGESVAVHAQDWQKALGNYGLLLLAGILACTPLVRWIYQKLEKRWVGMLLLAACFWFCIHRILLGGNNPFLYLNF